MWAQMIKARLKDDQADKLIEIFEKVRALEPSDSGLVFTAFMREQKDPRNVYTVVVFPSEEAARAREKDPKRDRALGPVRALMAEVFDGPPEFIDLDVVASAP